jgi:hypothetical protein
MYARDGLHDPGYGEDVSFDRLLHPIDRPASELDRLAGKKHIAASGDRQWGQALRIVSGGHRPHLEVVAEEDPVEPQALA